MAELLETINKLHMSKDDVIMEAECVENYNEWLHMALMGYSSEELMDAAAQM